MYLCKSLKSLVINSTRKVENLRLLIMQICGNIYNNILSSMIPHLTYANYGPPIYPDSSFRHYPNECFL